MQSTKKDEVQEQYVAFLMHADTSVRWYGMTKRITRCSSWWHGQWVSAWVSDLVCVLFSTPTTPLAKTEGTWERAVS